LLARRELAHRYYEEYLPYVGGSAYKRTWLSSYLAHEVQAFLDADTRNVYDILVIEAPPQHGKSYVITEALPSWILGRHPEWRSIVVSYNNESAERFCRRNKEKTRAVGATLFGHTIGKIDHATEYELDNDLGHPTDRMNLLIRSAPNVFR
jgi:hypothetical protein